MFRVWSLELFVGLNMNIFFVSCSRPTLISMGKLRRRRVTGSFFVQHSVVGTATRYGLDHPGIEYRWGEFFRVSRDRP